MSYLLPLPTDSQARTYLIKTDTVVHIGGLTEHNQSEIRIQLTHQPEGRAKVQGLSYRQTAVDGANRIASELAQLRHNLLLTLRPNGSIDRIDNQVDLAVGYKALRANWERRYPTDADLNPAFYQTLERLFSDPDRLLQTLSRSPELSLLLPALYGQSYAYDEPVNGPSAFITPLTNTLVVPLQTTVTRRQSQYPDVALDLLLEGRINEPLFPYEETREWLQELTGLVDIDPMPEIQYVLTFEFDRQHQLLHAGRFVTCIYENLAMSKTVTMLSPAPTTSTPR